MQEHEAGKRVVELLEQNIRPRDIMTREAFMNAISVVLATGGSTNAVLHYLAIAHDAKVPLTIDDFDDMSRKTPVIGDMLPGGRYSMPDLGEAGGLPIVIKRLAEAGMFDTNQKTVAGGIWADHLDRFTSPRARMSCARSTTRATPRAAWRSCAATWRPRARW